jgi:hypothetical protein
MRTTLANCAWMAGSLPAWRRFRSALARPAETQRGILLRMLRRNSGSEYGRALGFENIRNYAEFSERVPVVDHELFHPWIARIMAGEPAVLTSGPVTHLLPTSGSTGGRKLIPFTVAFQHELNAAISPWLLDLTCRHPSLLSGSAYWSISPSIQQSRDENSAVPVGFESDSSYLGGMRRWLAEATFAVPAALRLVADMECFRYLTLLSLLRRPDLALISVWHPSFLTLLLEALPAFWPELLHDVKSGGCRRASGLDEAVTKAIASPASPARFRALSNADPRDTRSVWPRLRLVSCWGDAQAMLPMRSLQTSLHGITVQPKGLLATEAVVSIPFQGLHPLAVTSHFYEFIAPDGSIRLAHELRGGECYEVVVTTSGGLWRYRLGDMVEVDGFLGATPSLRFIGRGAGISDLCGEKLSESFVNSVLAETFEIFGITPRFAMLAPERADTGRWRYTLFMEAECIPEASLLARLETGLRENPHYALCRDLGQLDPPRCFRIKGGAYAKFVRVAMSGGQRLGDIKPQALSLRTDWAGEFE